MAVIQRPAKEGNATTYQGKVAAGYTKILAAEVDADIDTIYAAWNAGVDTVNIKDGSVAASKLAPGAVTGTALAPGSITSAALAAGSVTSAAILNGTIVGADIAASTITDSLIASVAWSKLVAPFTGSVQLNPRGNVAAAATYFELHANVSGDPAYDNTKPSYMLRLDYTGDNAELWRAPPPGTSWVRIWYVTGAGVVNTSYPAGFVTRALLGVNASNGNLVGIVSPNSWSLSTPNVWTPYVTLPNITTRGGWVLLHANNALSVAGNASGGLCSTRWLRSGTQVTASSFLVTGTAYYPTPGCNTIDTPPAGTWSYQLQAYVSTNCFMLGTSDTQSAMQAAEIG